MNQVIVELNTSPSTRALPKSPSVRNYAVLGVVLWFVISLLAGWFGLFSQPDQPPLYFGLFIGVPLIVFTALYLASAQFRAFAHSISLPLITGAHVWRFVGLGFIIAYFFGKLPPEFAIPEGVGDIVAAILALPLALAIHRGRPVRKWFVLWNVYGLADLVSAITVGVLYSQGVLGTLRTGLSTELMTTFPVHLIPTFFVPLFIMFHVLALIRRNEVGSIPHAAAPRT